ncbi:MAG TPA: aspartate 1-decarboxylase [Bryobacteraceae bacterium]
MTRKFLRAKIHRATVTQSDLHYEGSISIDTALMRAAGMVEFEAVHVWNINNGERFETYIIPAKENSGEIGLNGAAARRAQVGDRVILATFCHLDEAEAKRHQPAIVFVDERNRQQKTGAPVMDAPALIET